LVLHSKFGSTPESVTSCTVILQYISVKFTCVYCTERGHAVAQLVEALRYKSEGRGFDSRWSHWNVSLT